MRSMHLFAGGGGGLLADLILGHRPVIAVEWERYPCQSLRERAAEGWFPDLRVWEGDVRMFDASEYRGRVDVIHAGFPCQDISLAGKQAGVGEGTRSGLYREVLRISSEVRPRYIFLENVSAIVTNGLGTVLGDLASMGYSARWCCLRASDVGAPHHRDRWWLLATNSYSSNGGSEQECEHQWAEEPRGSGSGDVGSRSVCDTVCDGESSISGREREMGGSILAATGRQQASDESVGSGEDVANTISSGCEDGSELQPEQGLSRSDGRGSVSDPTGLGDPKQQEPHRGEDSAREERPEFTDELCGVEDARYQWWQAEPGVGRMVDGMANRVHRLKALGNGQVPLQAAVAWKILGGE